MHNRKRFFFCLYSLHIPNHLTFSTHFGTETNTCLLQAPGHSGTKRPDVANEEDGFRKWKRFTDVIHKQLKPIERSSIFEIVSCGDKHFAMVS